MTDLKAKMHQIRFRLGLRPRPRWELTALPRPLAGFGGRFAAGGGAVLGWAGLGWGRGGKGEGSGREGEVEGREREGPQVTVEPRNLLVTEARAKPGLAPVKSHSLECVSKFSGE